MYRLLWSAAVAGLLAGGPQAQSFRETTLTASDGAAGDDFGESVAVFDGTVLVGAPDGVGTELNSGSAYLFDVDGTELRKLTPSDGARSDAFGSSVVLWGGTALVGAP